MSLCERTREALLEMDLDGIEDVLDDPALGAHLEDCDACAELLNHIEEREGALSDLITDLAAMVAPDVDPTVVRQGELLTRRRRRVRWRVLLPAAVAVMVGVAFFGPRARVTAPYAGGPDWALPVANLQSIQPVVVSTGTHRSVAVLPTDNPNITIVWFMD